VPEIEVEVDSRVIINLLNMVKSDTPGVYDVYTPPRPLDKPDVELPLRLGEVELGTYVVTGVSPAPYRRASSMRFVLTLDHVRDPEPESESEHQVSTAERDG
jgi:hypothetical protein